jgi:hypothetical protein
VLSATQIIYSAFIARPLPPRTVEGTCRLCGGDLIGETAVWARKAGSGWTAEGLARFKSSGVICEACSWAFSAQAPNREDRINIFSQEHGRNHGFVARPGVLVGFASINDVLAEIKKFRQVDGPSVWLLKTGKIQKPVLFSSAVSYPPYLRITFFDGDARAREIIARPEQILDLYAEIAAVADSKERQRLAERSPAGEFVNWLVNAQNYEMNGKQKKSKKK